MIVDLITLGSSPRDFEFSLEAQEIDLEGEEVKLKNAVNVHGTLTKRIAQTDVEGEIGAQIEVECTRCLQLTEQKLEIEFEAAFVSEENYMSAKEAEIGAKDLDVSVIEDDKIDLTELVREQILLNLPEQVFCLEDCKGLCPKCGANRNLIDCNCREKEIDPRWAALSDFRF